MDVGMFAPAAALLLHTGIACSLDRRVSLGWRTDGAKGKRFSDAADYHPQDIAVYGPGVKAAEPAQMVQTSMMQQWPAMQERKGSGVSDCTGTLFSCSSDLKACCMGRPRWGPLLVRNTQYL